MANHRIYHPDRPASAAERAKKYRQHRKQLEDERHDSGAAMLNVAEPDGAVIVTPSTVTHSESVGEIGSKQQEQITATCHVCGRKVEVKNGQIEWHVNFGTYDYCAGGADFWNSP